MTHCNTLFKVKFDLCMINKKESMSLKKSKNLNFLWILSFVFVVVIVAVLLWFRNNKRAKSFNVQVSCLVKYFKAF